jgi:hypothetical protein
MVWVDVWMCECDMGWCVCVQGLERANGGEKVPRSMSRGMALVHPCSEKVPRSVRSMA